MVGFLGLTGLGFEMDIDTPNYYSVWNDFFSIHVIFAILYMDYKYIAEDF